MGSQFPRLANLGDVPRLLSGDRVHRSWPPPGTTVLPISGPEPWVVVTGAPSEGEDGDWWVTDLETIAGFLDETVEQVLERAAALIGAPAVGVAAVLGKYPVIYTQGEVNIMRWLKVTHRGLLGSTEQFQFQINLGDPGADPDLNEAQALALAGTLRDMWKIAWTAGLNPASGRFSADVKFTEVGVVQEELNTATNADGSGGDLAQAYATQWAAWTVGQEPVGVQGGPSLPYEVAMAVTLQSDHRGPSGRGRFYLPPLAAAAMGDGGLFSTSARSDIGNTISSYLSAIVGGTAYVPVVVSKRRKILNTVTSANVGLVPDSQRRRRRSQDEARSNVYVAA